MDWSEKVLCIKCNESGNVLVCSEDGCPLAVHEGCMGFPASLDDEGRYYCPYCSYKQAVAESRKAREYALAKKKSLMLFMNDKMMGNEEHAEEDMRAQDPSPKLHEDQNISNGAGRKSQEENQSISNVEETMNQDEEHETSAASSGQNPSRNKHNTCDIEEGKIQDICETPSPPTGEAKRTVRARATRRSTSKKPVERDSEAVSPMHSTRKPSRRSSSALENKKQSNQLVRAPKRLKQPEKLPVKLEKHKGIPWTKEEEEAIKEGVEFFSKEAKIPWTKILQMSSSVFHATRTTNQIKKKWGKMSGK